MIDCQDLDGLLRALDAAELRRRLDELDAERAALLALLRAARARDRARRRTSAAAQVEHRREIRHAE